MLGPKVGLELRLEVARRTVIKLNIIPRQMPSPSDPISGEKYRLYDFLQHKLSIVIEL
jgi:hypothetical protein